MLSLNIPNAKQTIILSGEIIEQFLKSRQIKLSQREIGGQLFARISQDEIIIEKTFFPDKRDKRTRTSFFPNRKKQKDEISHCFSNGLHYVGDWHTHPETAPSPSSIDLESMRECFIKSKHELNSFILIVVGNSRELLDLWIGLINNFNVVSLNHSYKFNQ